MKFSIITCTWNSEPYLAQSIESVLSQDYPDIEYIFVDGGSTDGTLERIRRIERPHTLIENVRGGISKAMNEGIKAATGDVIAHLHSDDYYLDAGVLSQVADVLSNPDVGWVIGRIVVDDNGNLIPEMKAQPAYSYARFVRGGYFVPHPSTFVRRSILDKAGMFDEGLRYAMDMDLWHRIGKISTPGEIRRPLTAFRRHQGSLSNSQPMLSQREEIAVWLKHARSMPFDLSVYLARRMVRSYRLKRQIAKGDWM